MWNKVFSGIKYNIKKINHKCKSLNECKGFPDCETFYDFQVNYDDDFDKIKFVSNDNLPIRKLIYFPTITVTIRCVLKQGDLLYPQVYLDDVLYQLQMISYEKISGYNKNKEGAKCMVCNSYY